MFLPLPLSRRALSRRRRDAAPGATIERDLTQESTSDEIQPIDLFPRRRRGGNSPFRSMRHNVTRDKPVRASTSGERSMESEVWAGLESAIGTIPPSKNIRGGLFRR